MTQKKKEAVKTRFLRRSQGTEEVVVLSDSNQNLMILIIRRQFLKRPKAGA